MEERTKKINMITYGCSYNQATSEIISGLLSKNGFRLVETPEKSDIIIILSCVVKTPTENKIIAKIKTLFAEYPEKKIIVGGCLPEVIPERIKEISKRVNYFGPHFTTEIVDIVNKTIQGKSVELIGKRYECRLGVSRKRINPIIGIIQISQGCHSNCAYCCVKIAMGDFLAYPHPQIKKEIMDLLKSGCKEIWITAQDTALYRYDDLDLADLINEITKIKSRFNIRIGMMNPKSVIPILQKLTEVYSQPNLYKFLHLPLQSGDNDILAVMNRNYTIEDFLKIVREFRNKFPLLTLSTDLIIGFPGETEVQFKNSLKLLEKIKPDIVNISRFGRRPKTKAKKMNNQIPPDIIKKRSKIATDLVNQLTLERNKKWINWEGEVLVSEKSKYGDWIGRNYAYKPVVIKSSKNLLGKFIKIHVDKARPGYLV
ncbi:MAG: tRNA (N(6)-L-threonylcarbamoyladenosine(37)-C(2))-methylthiotransferase [Candidatus Helarchaeota archaeon]